MSDFETYATFFDNKGHRDSFINGNLVEEWYRLYPLIFDKKDRQIALNQHHLGIHYHEWFAAILLFHMKGFLSLIEAYAYKSHERKRKILESLVSGDALDFIASTGISSVTQCPDLLLYKPDKSDWFFCEVKGPQDSLREKQIILFHELERVTGKNVYMFKFINQEDYYGNRLG
jgi:hypothetical protein